jgi:hypothetical protein
MKKNYKNEHFGIKEPGPVWKTKVCIGYCGSDGSTNQEPKKWKIKVILN